MPPDPLSSLARGAYVLKIRMARETTPPEVLQYFVCSKFLALRNYSTFVQEPPLYIYKVARGPVPVSKPEGLESRLDHVSARKGLKQCARSEQMGPTFLFHLRSDSGLSRS